ncbi:MAG: hypothetical protein ABSE75_13885 [Acidimicrobiales bacterium]
MVASIAGSLASIDNPANAAAGPKVRDGLHLGFVNVPTMHEGYVFVSGTIPQIDNNYLLGVRSSPSFRNVRRINADIEDLAVTLEARYWKTLLKYCVPFAKSRSDNDLEKVPSYFGTMLNSSLILANNATLSFVVPTLYSFCEGTGNEDAISSTYSLQSGKPIDLLSSLFASRLKGERLLAKLVSQKFNEGKSSGDRCIQKQGGPVSLKTMRGYIDKANSLGVTHVALARKGITILVEQCYLAACACGDSLANVSYQTVWNSLSKSGRNLLLGIR